MQLNYKRNFELNIIDMRLSSGKSSMKIDKNLSLMKEKGVATFFTYPNVVAEYFSLIVIIIRRILISETLLFTRFVVLDRILITVLLSSTVVNIL